MQPALVAGLKRAGNALETHFDTCLMQAALVAGLKRAGNALVAYLILIPYLFDAASTRCGLETCWKRA